MSPTHSGASARARDGDGARPSVDDVLAAAVAVLQRYEDRDRLVLDITAERADTTPGTVTARHRVTVDCSPSATFDDVRSSIAERLPAPPPEGHWTVLVTDAGAPDPGTGPRPTARGELTLRPGAGATIVLEHPHASGPGLREAVARVLAAGTARPGQELATLPVLSQAETDLQRQRLAGLPSPVPAETTIHELVRAAADRHPERVAAACDTESLTYRELVARSERLARALLAHGVARGEVVAVVAERSCAVLTAALGVLTAGGAFFLLDPTLPEARRAQLLTAAGVRLVVTTRAGRAALTADRPTVVLEDLGPADTHHGLPRLHGDDLAYLIHTSGSRGEPKGVLVRHRSFVNRQQWLIDRLGLGPEDVSLGRTALSFDPAICEMFRLLPVGGRVWFLPTGHERDPARVLDAIERERVTVVDLVPSPLRSLLEHVAALGLHPALSSLRWVLAGAETLHPWLVGFFEEVAGHRGGAHLLNGWGATEVCVDVTSFDCSAEPAGDPVPVGRPIPGVGVAVLDRHGRFTPLGVPGELFVRGRCLAAGYLDDAELTDERFVRRPVAGPELLYRSGDRVRWRADGNLEFLGRLDDELSVRGLRIAPAEIESVLRRHPAVDDAVVRTVGGGPSAEAGAERLIAWVTHDASSAPPDPDAVRAHVGAFLPSTMVPEAVHVLDAFPRTTHDKVDIEALPTGPPALAGRSGTGPPRSLSDATEDTLVALWHDVLEGAAIGPDDDVIAQGATSLDAARMATRAAAGVCGRLDVVTIFAHPTIRAQARVVRGCAHSSCRVARLEPTPPAETVPASHSQLRHWIASRLDATSSAYNIAVGAELDEVPDPAVLRAAVDELTDRHEILRTTFSLVDSELVQHIRPPGTGWVPVEVGTAADPSRYLRATAERPFATADGPLLRIGLITPTDPAAAPGRGTVLYLVIHHLISDTWSLTLLLTELAARCRALAAGEGPAELPPARLQYRDYTAWERARLAGPVGHRLRRFWTDRLAGPLPALDLPLDAPRGAAKAPGADVRRFTLGPEVTDALRSWAGNRRATLFMALLTATSVWLHRLTGQRDLIIGTPVAGRAHVDLEDVLGSFVNSVALRTRVDPNAPLDELLAHVRSTALDAFAHEEYPLDLVVRDLGLVRDPGRSALFDVMLVLQNAPGARTESVWGEPRARRVDVDRSVGKLDMIVTFAEDEDGLRGEIEYDSHLFASTTIERWSAGLSRTIAALPHSAGATVAALASSALEAPTAPALLHTAVERHARLTPEHPAVVCEDRVLTYGELNRTANRLARRLRDEFGVGPGRIVGYALERTERVPVAQLAILKAGGAFLGIDPAHPEARRRAVLEDARPVLLMVDGHNRGLLPEGLGWLPVLALDEEPDPTGRGERPADPAPVTGADDPAYIIYTSGSTGTPKGVVLEHANALALLQAGGWPFEFRGDDVWTSTHSIAFDFSVWEIHLPLSRGARVVVVPEATRRDPRQLLPLLVRERVTVLSQVPSTFERLVDELDRHPGPAPGCLRYVVLGGEPVNPAAVRRFAGHLPGVDVVNGYGITETTVFTTFKRLDRTTAPGSPTDAQNIGRPIGTVSVDLLDPDGKPVPDGGVGEIVISGPTVARGYLGRPEETARAFGVHPPDPRVRDGHRPRRWYRSGDLARRLPSGDLVFVGRRDRQVKIRGYRVELEEVRAVILGTGLLNGDAVTDVRTGPTGAPTLVAYVDDRDRERIPALRRRLRELLPAPMVPARFVGVDAWPTTANGKVDLDALHTRTSGPADGPVTPAPEKPAPAEDRAPDTVAVLRALWSELLGRPGPGPDDNFFSVGGHSLLAVALVTRVEEELGVTLALEDVLTYSTLARQAELIDARRTPAEPPATRPAAIPPSPHADDYPLSPAQSEFWLLDQFRDPKTPAALPEILDLGTAWDPAAARATFAGLVESFEILRTVFPLVGDHPRQRVRPHGHEDALRQTGLSRSPTAEDLRRILDEEANRPLDLAEGPLFRLHLVGCPGESTLAVVTAHHIVWDGMSFDVLARWWQQDQRARRDGRAAPRPPTRQFRDIAAHHLAYLASPGGRAELAWWTERLAGLDRACSDLTPLGIGRRTGPRDFIGRRHWVSVDARRTRALRTLCAETGATLFSGLHALVKAFLFAMTGQTDIVVMSPASLRDGPALDEQLGPLVNTLGVRGRVDPRAPFSALLDSVRRSVLDTLAHRWIPPGDIGRSLGLDADAPLADVGLTLQPRTLLTDAGDVPRPDTVFGAHTALWFDITERADTLDVEIVAPRTRTDDDTLAGLGGAFLQVVETLLDHADDPLDRTVGAASAPPPAPLTIELRY